MTKKTPVAKVTGGPDGNRAALHKLHPSSLGLPDHRPKILNKHPVTRSHVGSDNRKKAHISPKLVVKALNGLNCGNAGGLQVDSLDLFVKVAKWQKKGKNKRYSDREKILAKLFTDIVNGKVPAKTVKIQRTTYLIALEKDPDDLSKLQPLGVPSAIRRIAVVLILQSHRASFAQYLLPFNYAIGVNRGIDMITTDIQLGVEKFITAPEEKGNLPSQALVSLYIKHMFNAISRQKLREIVGKEFPGLSAFANLLYESE